MAEELATFEKFFRSQVTGLAAVTTCVGDRFSNMYAAPKAMMPYAVFQVGPLEDLVGQARQTVMTRLLVDLKFVSGIPVPDTVFAAVKAVREHFRTSLSFEFEGYRISVRHERPINIPETGAVPGEQLVNRGGSYLVWMHELPS